MARERLHDATPPRHTIALTTRQAAAVYGTTERTIRKWATTGRVYATRGERGRVTIWAPRRAVEAHEAAREQRPDGVAADAGDGRQITPPPRDDMDTIVARVGERQLQQVREVLAETRGVMRAQLEEKDARIADLRRHLACAEVVARERLERVGALEREVAGLRRALARHEHRARVRAYGTRLREALGNRYDRLLDRFWRWLRGTER